MAALELDKLSWPEVEAERDRGRSTVVVAFGATEQHGPHMPLAVDALIGDHFAGLIADRLDAFVAPTVRLGCSSHHLDFPGTISISDETFYGVVEGIITSMARGGFARLILLPTHGGNFAPLAAAVEKVGEVEGLEVIAMTDLSVLFKVAAAGEAEFNVPLGEGGLHAGEWETSMMLAIHPDLVTPERGAPGFTGDVQSAVEGMFAGGVKAIAENGIVGDPAQASAEHGQRYWELALELALAEIEP